MTTFGFEAEFHNSVARIATALYEAGRTYTSDIHNYTCDCIGCSYNDEEPYDLRVKFDSSCGGEVISRILDSNDMDSALALFRDVQRCAFDTDSVPGLQAGFHVHIARPRRRVERGRIIHNFMVWEDVLADLAGGRWPHNRGWNASLVGRARHAINAWLIGTGDYSTGDLRWMESREALMKCVPGEDYYLHLADESTEWERHATLATSGRHPTIEFRLWNSTRVAWRMELWCRLSLALGDRPFLDLLNMQATDSGVGLDEFIEVVDAYGDDALTELVARQRTYQDRIRSGELVVAEAVA